MEKTGEFFTKEQGEKNGSSADLVAERLREIISEGKLTPGDKLPPERDLAKMLGVSRPTLRAGIRSLTTVGILRSRQGAGTYVAPAGDLPVLDPVPLRILASFYNIDMSEFSETYRLIRQYIAGLAAERATSEQMTVLAEEVAGMYAGVNDPELFDEHECTFHRMLLSAAGNRVLAALAGMLRFSAAETHDSDETRDLFQACEQNRAIYQAMRQRNISGAYDAMGDYLTSGHITPTAW